VRAKREFLTRINAKRANFREREGKEPETSSRALRGPWRGVGGSIQKSEIRPFQPEKSKIRNKTRSHQKNQKSEIKPVPTRKIRNPKSGIRNPKSGIRNPKSGIRNQELEIRNQESEIRN